MPLIAVLGSLTPGLLLYGVLSHKEMERQKRQLNHLENNLLELEERLREHDRLIDSLHIQIQTTPRHTPLTFDDIRKRQVEKDVLREMGFIQ